MSIHKPHRSSHESSGRIMSEQDRERLDQFKKELKDDAEITDDQRDRASEDMRFVNVAGGMWEDFLTSDDSDTVDRVRLELDIVSDFLQGYIGEWGQNRVGVEYKPNDKGTTTEDSELLNGIYRSDFRQYSGRLATDNAVNEVATCGYSAFKLATRFENEGDPENDNQVIEWRPIYNAFNTVFWDAAAKRPDKADAVHCTVLEQFTPDSLEREYPGADPVSAYDPETRSYTTSNFRDIPIVYIATRYEVVDRKEDVWVYNNLLTGKVETYTDADHDKVKDELAQDKFRQFVRKRKIKRQIIEKTVFSGNAILEPTRRVVGRWIPIIPFYGFRAYVGNQEWYRGLVRKMKDAQRLFNMQVSQLAENAASAGQEIPIFDPLQMENPDIKNIWADKNNKAYLLADSLRDADGKIVKAGPVGYSKPGQLDGSTQSLLQIVPNYIESVTGGPPQEAFRKDLSGKAINALIKRENRKTQVINENITMSIAWSGTVYQAMAAEVYTTQRMVKTIARDGSESEEMLLGVVIDEETGMSVESNDLRGKQFQSYADVGPQYETLREQTVEDAKGMLETLSQIPAGEQYIPVLLAVIMDNMVGVGLDPIKELNRNVMLSQGMVKPQTPEEEEFVRGLREQQNQPDPSQALIEAAAAQQQAEARSLDAASIQKVADAKKKAAETTKILSEVGNARIRLFMEQQQATRDQAARGLAAR